MSQKTIQACRSEKNGNFFRGSNFLGLNNYKFLKIFLLFCFTAALSVRGEVILAENGQAKCTIIMDSEPSLARIHFLGADKITRAKPAYELPEAAKDLAKHLNRIFSIAAPDKQFRLIKFREAINTPYRILLGSAAIREYGLEKEAESLPYPAYIYRVVGNDLLIFGSSPKGTANGIYGFLQDELGVRWFGAQELFHVIPKRKTVTINKLNKRVVPSFLGRQFHVSTTLTPNYIWGRRYMRMGETADNCEPFINASHYLYRIFPVSVYAAKHPEYYPLRNGKRHFDHVYDWTPCLTNPDVLAIAIKSAKNAFRANPKMHSFSLGINDTRTFCQCAACQKYKNKNKVVRFGNSIDWESNVYYHFVNQVAKAVKEEFPGRYIGCIAYNNVTAPPAFPLEENVFVVIVSDMSEYYDKFYREEEERLIRAWEEKCKTLGFYYYEGLAKLVPAYFPHLVSEELKKKHRQGFHHLTCEVFPGWPWTGPMVYITAQLWWDVDLNIDKLLDGYFDELYGPAAKPMKTLYDLFEQIHMRPRRGGFLYEHYKLVQFRPYTADDLKKMRKYLKQAHSLAAKSNESDIARRVLYVDNGLKAFLSMLEAYTKAQEFENPTNLADASVLKRLQEVDRVMSILNGYDALYSKTILSDETQSKRYRVDRCIPVRNAWKVFVNSAINKTLAAIYLANKKHAFKSQVRDRLKKTLDTFSREPGHRILFLLNTQQAELGPNLITNSGFEVTKGPKTFPTGPEWVSSQVSGWSVYPEANKAGIGVDTQHKHSGKRAAKLSGVLDGYYITKVPVKPNVSYLASMYAKCILQQAEMTSTIQLEVRWMDGKSRWVKSECNTTVKLHDFNEWKKLEQVVKAPPGVSFAVVLLRASMPMGEQVFFDDVEFCQVGGTKLEFGSNIVPNSGFEQVWGEGVHKNCPPEKKGIPFNWNIPKLQQGTIDTTTNNSYAGQRCARMKGVGSAYLLVPTSTLPKSHRTYLCEAWAKLNKSASARVYMQIRWYGSKGWIWNSKQWYTVDLRETGKWSKMAVVAQAPEEALRMAVFLTVENLDSDNEVFFDHVMVRPILTGW